MDIYHIWCDLQPGIRDLDFSNAVEAWLGDLAGRGLLEQYRITRCKLGLKHDALPEWHMMLETRNLAQLEDAFQHAASRKDPAESLHRDVYGKVQNVKFALYRDFPDAVRMEE